MHNQIRIKLTCQAGLHTSHAQGKKCKIDENGKEEEIEKSKKKGSSRMMKIKLH